MKNLLQSNEAFRKNGNIQERLSDRTAEYQLRYPNLWYRIWLWITNICPLCILFLYPKRTKYKGGMKNIT
jgi:hypothetical protein